MTVVNEAGLRIVRTNTTRKTGRVSSFEMHYLVGTGSGVSHFVEKHRAGLYTVEEMKKAFTTSGLSVVLDPQGPTGRGLYIARG